MWTPTMSWRITRFLSHSLGLSIRTVSMKRPSATLSRRSSRPLMRQGSAFAYLTTPGWGKGCRAGRSFLRQLNIFWKTISFLKRVLATQEPHESYAWWNEEEVLLTHLFRPESLCARPCRRRLKSLLRRLIHLQVSTRPLETEASRDLWQAG